MASFIPKVSVILPVYQKNNEYLDLSVESILGQSLKEFEEINIFINIREKKRGIDNFQRKYILHTQNYQRNK